MQNYIYARSSNSTNNFNQYQIDKIKTKEDIEFNEIYSDICHGCSIKRPGLTDLIRTCHIVKGPIVIYVIHLDRFARDKLLLKNVLSIFQSLNVTIKVI